MFVVGVTGGIGSGKTAATNCFQALGIDIVDADLASRVVVEPGTEALQRIAEHFGPHILQADGALDRAALRRIIFQEPAAKQWLEQLLHPLIGQEIQRQLQSAASPYAILVSPLLIEARQNLFCNRILVVDAPEDTQLQRTVIRDNNDPEQVRRIIASQASRAQRLEQADDILENSGSLEQLRTAVEQLHERYLQLAIAHDATEQ
jgi:dephospho-CoA kinase